MADSIGQVEIGPVLEVDATDLGYRELNTRLRNAAVSGASIIAVRNVAGQRYIGTSLGRAIEIDLHGTAGDDLGAFMDGPTIVVHGNAQDGCGNTMRSGEIIVHGRAGDMLGMSARGGKIFVRDDVGFRAGIHMKEAKSSKPVVVVGGAARDFLAQSMAGGAIVLLGLTCQKDRRRLPSHTGTDMHGGVIYFRGTAEDYQLGNGAGKAELDDDDLLELRAYVSEFARHFGYDAEEILKERFTKIFPLHRGGNE
ncbi:MAG: hypothetical protein QUS33_04395 [Dehalococcoidia bacterium]|nr:hypothetical protein [Dehalococcoidia bacterium]